MWMEGAVSWREVDDPVPHGLCLRLHHQEEVDHRVRHYRKEEVILLVLHLMFANQI